MRTSRIVVAATMALVACALGSPSPVQAVGERCRGQAATIVGQPGETVTGSDGDDVIVTNGEHDVDAGDGDDSVITGWEGGVDTDDVDLGTGSNYLTLASERSTGSLRAAPGSGSKVTLTVSSSGPWVINDRTDRARFKGRTMSSWANLGVAELHGARGARITYVGTDQADRPDIFGHVTGVDLGGGNDDVALYQFPRLRGSYLGGPGEDRVRFESGDELLVDLARGRLGTEIGHPTAQIHGFENLDALFFARVWLVGSGADNRMRFSTCDGSVNGGPGDDRIAMHGTGPSCDTDAPGILVHAGRGDDKIRGTPFGDTLYGGPGHDVAVGGDGTDICRAEVETTCEE